MFPDILKRISLLLLFKMNVGVAIEVISFFQSYENLGLISMLPIVDLHQIDIKTE